MVNEILQGAVAAKAQSSRGEAWGKFDNKDLEVSHLRKSEVVSNGKESLHIRSDKLQWVKDNER